MSDHATLAPSATHRWMHCPGSVGLIDRAVKVVVEDSVYAREGTFAHEIAANALREGLQGKPVASLVGATDGEFVVDEAMAGHLQTYVDVVQLLMMTEDTSTLLVEQSLVAIPDKVWGTGDAIIYVPHAKRMHVVDLKFGAGLFVSVEDNPQLLTYALGALRLAREQGWTVDEVVLHVVQPRRADSDGEVHRSWLVPFGHMRVFGEQLSHAVRATEEPDARLVPGDYCGFCPARRSCPALHDRAMTVAQSVFGGVPLTPTAKPPHPTDLTPVQIGNVLDAAELLLAWVKGVQEHAETEARKGVPIPGRKLVETMSNRRWTDEAAAQKLLESVGASPWAPRKIVSPAEAERRIGKGSKAVKELTERVVTGVTLVSENDKRPRANAASVFRALPLESDNTEK